MAFTFGFYNSIDHDRRYNAQQMSAIFDGIITDGVFDSIGEIFATVPGTGMQVLVKTGKAWFNHTWSINDSYYQLDIDPSDILLDRIDAVVLEVNNTDTVRANSLKIVKGTNGSIPPYPTLIDTENVHQHPLAYVTVRKQAESIAASDINIVVGQTACPFVTGLLESVDITDLFNQWNGEFDEWFENLQEQLSDNVVTNLLNQINQRVKISDKATDTDISTGNDSKWVSAKGLKEAVENSIGSANTPDGKTLHTEVIPCSLQTERLHYSNSSIPTTPTFTYTPMMVDTKNSRLFVFNSGGPNLYEMSLKNGGTLKEYIPYSNNFTGTLGNIYAIKTISNDNSVFHVSAVNTSSTSYGYFIDINSSRVISKSNLGDTIQREYDIAFASDSYIGKLKNNGSLLYTNRDQIGSGTVRTVSGVTGTIAGVLGNTLWTLEFDYTAKAMYVNEVNLDAGTLATRVIQKTFSQIINRTYTDNFRADQLFYKDGIGYIVMWENDNSNSLKTNVITNGAIKIDYVNKTVDASGITFKSVSSMGLRNISLRYIGTDLVTKRHYIKTNYSVDYPLLYFTDESRVFSYINLNSVDVGRTYKHVSSMNITFPISGNGSADNDSNSIQNFSSKIKNMTPLITIFREFSENGLLYGDGRYAIDYKNMKQYSAVYSPNILSSNGYNFTTPGIFLGMCESSDPLILSFFFYNPGGSYNPQIYAYNSTVFVGTTRTAEAEIIVGSD